MRPLGGLALVALAGMATWSVQARAQCTRTAYGIGEAGAGWMTLETDGSVWLAEQSMTDPPISLKARKVVTLGNEVVAIGENDGESGTFCAIKADRSLWCWGQDDTDQVGQGETTYYRSEPAMVLSDVKQVANSAEFTCATRMDGTVWCWGINTYGQLGTGDLDPRPTPTQVAGLVDVDVVSAGFEHACALTTAGALSCWGGDTYGEVGVRDDLSVPMSFTTPQLVTGITGTIAQISAGGFYTMIVTDAGQVWAWGDNAAHHLAIGDTSEHSRPLEHPTLTSVAQVDAGVQHGCAVYLDGTVWCWGRNVAGELGLGTISDTEEAATPTQVPGLAGVRSIHVVDRNVCAVKMDDSLWCWGSGGFMDASGQTSSPRLIDYCEFCEPADCLGATPACLDGVCAVCTDDAHCTDPAHPACDLTSGACGECNENFPCASGTCDVEAMGGPACLDPTMGGKPHSSCGCRAGGRTGGGASGAALLLALALLRARGTSQRWCSPRDRGRSRRASPAA